MVKTTSQGPLGGTSQKIRLLLSRLCKAGTNPAKTSNFTANMHVLDCGAAPGSWSQVVKEYISPAE